MKFYKTAVAVLFVLVCSCKTVKVDNEKYAWKSFDNSDLDQSIDLKQYESPNNRLGQDKDKLVIVCASGGGSRAAAFNIGIMLELERILKKEGTKVDSSRNALNEIDYFSTVSGGGWGISSFIAYQYQKQKYSTLTCQTAINSYNSLPQTTTRNRIEVFPTFNSYEKYLANRADFRYYKYQIPYILTFWNSNAKSDMTMTNRLNAGYLGWSYRADVEEKMWMGTHNGSGVGFSTNDVDEIVLGDVFKTKGSSVMLPMQITNTTNIDNFKLVPFTPDRLNYWGVRHYRHYLNGMSALLNTGSIADYASIPLASGTKPSSGIPFAVSASSFPAIKQSSMYGSGMINYYLHLQDGGIVDQQAVHSAKAILKYHGEIKERKNRIVFIIDASGAGIENKKKFKKNNASRGYNAARVIAPFTAPDSQYALTRERIKLLEDEYNCTVIYLGTELLLDKSLNMKPGSITLPTKKEAVENYFYSKYPLVRSNTTAFLALNFDERKLLYAYISKYVPTWFASGDSELKGRIIVNNANSTATIMFLAGRGVVELKRQEIENAINR